MAGAWSLEPVLLLLLLLLLLHTVLEVLQLWLQCGSMEALRGVPF